MYTQTQVNSKIADDSDDDNDDYDESGYTGSTTGGDSGMEVPLYTIPILRKQETTTTEGKGCIHKQLISLWPSFHLSLFTNAEEPEYHFPQPQDPVKTWLPSHIKHKLKLNQTD